jgi:predicted RNA-binding Zn-ribbon protein involved in translation (DUF1610 family)
VASLDEGRSLDGNALAGLLRELFDRELTEVVRGCPSCGDASPIGAHRAYRGPGVVLRCPACGDVALTVVTAPDRHIVRLRGAWTFELARP